MTEKGLDKIESELKIILPVFYKTTMLNYPFKPDSYAKEFSLTTDVEQIIGINSTFEYSEKKFAVGTDGGEWSFYIKLDSDDKVYIFDLEESHINNTIFANSWDEYLKNIAKEEEDIEKEMEKSKKRKVNKKWWQFWI